VKSLTRWCVNFGIQQLGTIETSRILRHPPNAAYPAAPSAAAMKFVVAGGIGIFRLF